MKEKDKQNIQDLIDFAELHNSLVRVRKEVKELIK